MSYLLYQKIERLQDIKARIKPKTFFDELSEQGLLDDYINTYMPEHFDYDEKFQTDVLDLVFKQSSTIMPNIQEFILKKLHHSLSEFQEIIKDA